jgi:hypothetical protein
MGGWDTLMRIVGCFLVACGAALIAAVVYAVLYFTS